MAHDIEFWQAHHTDYISNSAIFSNVITLSAYIQKMVSHIKPQFLSEQFQAPCEKVMESCTARCKILPFCAKTIMRESRKFDPASLKREEKKKNNFGYLVTFRIHTFTMLLHTIRSLDGSWTLKDEWYVAIKVYYSWEIFVSP